MMASSICALIFDMTSEEALVKNPNFDNNSLNSLSRLIARSLASWGQVKYMYFVVLIFMPKMEGCQLGT